MMFYETSYIRIVLHQYDSSKTFRIAWLSMCHRRSTRPIMLPARPPPHIVSLDFGKQRLGTAIATVVPRQNMFVLREEHFDVGLRGPRLLYCSGCECNREMNRLGLVVRVNYAPAPGPCIILVSCGAFTCVGTRNQGPNLSLASIWNIGPSWPMTTFSEVNCRNQVITPTTTPAGL
jgi:hypothetical protein